MTVLLNVWIIIKGIKQVFLMSLSVSGANPWTELIVPNKSITESP